MMGRMAKNKGARGEREVAALLNPIIANICAKYGVLPESVRRTTYMAANKGGDDLCGIEWASIEVKRHETVGAYQLRKWWEQACGQATLGRTPILLWRKNHQAWRARVRIGPHDFDLNYTQFVFWFEQTHEWWLTERLASA